MAATLTNDSTYSTAPNSPTPTALTATSTAEKPRIHHQPGRPGAQ